MSDEQVRSLVSALEAKHGRKINARVEIDPELIGGARIEVGDKVIDATVRGRLDAMAAALAH
jgi:F-type H+-transporting ATPase subunit delta